MGQWRDHDVLIDLAARKLKRTRNPDERRAWELVHGRLLRKRERAMRRGRRRLANRRLFTLAQDVRNLVDSARTGAAHNPHFEDSAAVMSAAIGAAYAQWRSALARASETHAPVDVHAFRVQTKRLRYRVELARDLGAANAEPVLTWLRGLQDDFGRWHDRSELARAAAEALARPKFLFREPRAAGLLLGKLAAQRKAETAETAKQLAETGKAPQLAMLESLAAERGTETHDGRPLAGAEAAEPKSA